MKVLKSDLVPKEVRVEIAEGSLVNIAESWRYAYKRYQDVYVQVKDARGVSSTLRLRVPR